MCQRPVLPGLISTAIPDQYRGHPLLQGMPFFTLPNALLDAVVQNVGRQRFDTDLLDMERAFSNALGESTSNVGYWRDAPVESSLLRPMAMQFSDRQIAVFAAANGLTVAAVQCSLAVGDDRLQWTVIARRGYCGWLMTNRQFLDEHAAIFGNWADEVRRRGIPAMGPVVRDVSSFPGNVMRATASTRDFIQEFEQFFIRWRLEALTAPWLPAPLALKLPVVDLSPLVGHMRHGGTTFYLPDILPIPSRDEFRNILEESLRRRRSADHLAEWTRIVRSGNPARNQIHRYSRIFEIQHYMRAIYGRHSQAMYRKQSSLVMALASFLDVNEATIKNDLQHIGRRLGSDWYLH